MSPVPYPKNTGAYPTAKPTPIAASSVTEAALAYSAPGETKRLEESLAPETDQSSAAKFFPLVPTSSSIYVTSNEQQAVVAAAAQAFPSEANDAAKVEGQAVIEAAIQETVVEAEMVESFAAVELDQVTPDEFEISSSLTPEPQTSSIVLQEVPDALLAGEIVTETGEVLVTGSIELPAITGELAVVSESPDADRADETDSSSLNLTTVAPVRAPAVMNSKASVGTIPNKHRRTSGQLMAMLTLGILIITVGSLYIMAAALGVV